jgi:DNA-binding transcriptional regulator GbsR (MarR family)
MKLSPVTEGFILHWGEMGSRWGVNRTVAQIHALLYLSPRPLPADEIAETLSVARSNVSTSLRELQGWGVVTVTHRIGDRRDHFQSITDVWELVTVIVEERKKREIDPTLALLRECVAEAGDDPMIAEESRERMSRMLEFVETATGWYDDIRKLPRRTLMTLLRMGARVARVLPG